MQPTRALLSDGRWHWQHGPIDLILHAEGPGAAAAHEAAWARFQAVLTELVSELSVLRQPVLASGACPLEGPVARRMWAACAPHAAAFITPMAAVAGAVADELIGCYRRNGVHRAWVNNGGDIALHLAEGQQARVGLFADLSRFQPGERALLDGRFTVHAGQPVRGVATSGWRGRSFSLGIADSVTVLARTAAEADAAATMIANAVNVVDPRIERRPAHELKDDTDLGSLPVTVQVPRLPPALVAQALESGTAHALQLRERGFIHAAALFCQGQAQVVPAQVSSPHEGDAPAAGPALLGSVFA